MVLHGFPYQNFLYFSLFTYTVSMVCCGFPHFMHLCDIIDLSFSVFQASSSTLLLLLIAHTKFSDFKCHRFNKY